MVLWALRCPDGVHDMHFGCTDGEDPRSPHSASQRSPRPNPRPSPRMVPNTVKNIVFPKNVIFNSDDIIVEDDDDEQEEKRSKWVKRVKQRQRRSRSRSTTPNRVRRHSLNDKKDRDESDASSENESESDDAGPAIPPPRRAVVREIAAKERNDPRKQQLPTTSTSKRPRAVRSLWSNDLVQDVKNEPDDTGGSAGDCMSG